MTATNLSYKLSLENVISETPSDTQFLPLKSQLRVISSILNFHQWSVPSNTGGVKKRNYLINEGTSPRNTILRMMIEGMIESEESEFSLDDAPEVLNLVIAKIYAIPSQNVDKYVSKRQAVKAQPKPSHPLSNLC